MSAFGPSVAGFLKIPGLENFEVRAGKSWPTGTRTFNLGTATLTWWLVEDGVLTYRWKKFDSGMAKRVWAFYYQAIKLVQRQWSLRPSTKLAIVVAAGVAVAMISALAAALLELAAAEELAVLLRTSIDTIKATVPRAQAVLDVARQSSQSALAGAAGTQVLQPGLAAAE